MVAHLRRGHRVGQSVVVQSCGVQLGRFHGEVPTAIGGPAAGVWGSRADSPQEVWQRLLTGNLREKPKRGAR